MIKWISRRAGNAAPIQALAATARRAATGMALVLAAVLGMSALASGAHAAIITFETAALGSSFTSASEGGFDYSAADGSLFVNSLGNDGQDMEGDYVLGGGTLKIVASDGSLFRFTGLDYAAWSWAEGTQILTVTGLLDDAIVGVEQFQLNNTLNFLPKYDNWTFFGADVLSLVTLDMLLITLNGSDVPYLQAVDNVGLEAVTEVAEPATLALLGANLAGLGLLARRRKAA